MALSQKLQWRVIEDAAGLNLCLYTHIQAHGHVQTCMHTHTCIHRERSISMTSPPVTLPLGIYLVQVITIIIVLCPGIHGVAGMYQVPLRSVLSVAANAVSGTQKSAEKRSHFTQGVAESSWGLNWPALPLSCFMTCVYECFACLYVHLMHVWCPQRSEKGVRSQRTRLMGVFKSPRG